MASWYKGSIQYQKEDESGALKVINEEHLVDSVSFTEAEARLYKNIISGQGEFSVKSISRMRLSDLFSYEEGEQWFKAKVIYLSVDERSGKEKKVVNFMLVNADGIQQALDRVNESMKNFLIPYEVVDMILTAILDVFPYEADGEEQVPENMRPLSEVMAERQNSADGEEENG